MPILSPQNPKLSITSNGIHFNMQLTNMRGFIFVGVIERERDKPSPNQLIQGLDGRNVKMNFTTYRFCE